MHERSVVSIDLDGVPFPRIGIQMEVFQPWSYNAPITPKHSQITRNDRIPVNRPLTRKERAELDIHSGRYVKPEVAELIRSMQVDTKIGNTGRPNTLPMITMTMDRLKEGGIESELEYVLFRIDEVSSDESKYWELKELENEGYTDIVHYDDNARTQRRLARALPHIRFVIVQDLTSGILFPRWEMENFPNVARIAIHKSGKIDVTHKSTGFGEFPHPLG